VTDTKARNNIDVARVVVAGIALATIVFTIILSE